MWLRMYRSLGEVWEGFTKNARAAFEDRPLGMFLFGLAQALLFLWPFAALVLPTGSLALVLAQIAIIYLLRGVLTVRFRTKVPDVLLSGNHAEIARWRAQQARLKTQRQRPDLLK